MFDYNKLYIGYETLKSNLFCWRYMRFILNFILFGVLFYIIFLAFPDAFFTMVGWANKIYEFLKGMYLQFSEKVHESPSGGSPHGVPQNALLLIPLWIKMTFTSR